MRTNQHPLSVTKHKLGRNDLCSCGSGKKYKKCCLLTFADEEGEEESLHYSTALLQPMMDKFKEKYEGKEAILETSEEAGLFKMSEVIFEFTQELMDLAKSKREKEGILMLAIVAWNLAVMAGDEPHAVVQHIEDFLQVLEFKSDSEEEVVVAAMLLALAEKKHLEFPDIQRIIVDFEIKETKKDFRLQVASVEASREKNAPILPRARKKQGKKGMLFGY